MKKILILAAAVASLNAVSAPAYAGFYFEGLMPYTDPPNCNDPYATTCGRYGQVPHTGTAKTVKPAHSHAAPTHVHPHVKAPMKPAVRYKTREGLDK
jgi:hypothetical protein